MRLPGPPVARDLALRLGDLGYSVDGIRDRLGAVAADALDRNEAVPARRVLDGDQSPLATAIRLFMLAQKVSRAKASLALGPLEDLADLLRLNGEAAASIFELAPCAVDENDWLVAADWPSARAEGILSKEHVLGVGEHQLCSPSARFDPRSKARLISAQAAESNPSTYGNTPRLSSPLT